MVNIESFRNRITFLFLTKPSYFYNETVLLLCNFVKKYKKYLNNYKITFIFEQQNNYEFNNLVSTINFYDWVTSRNKGGYQCYSLVQTKKMTVSGTNRTMILLLF
jgi:hypothetical protein